MGTRTVPANKARMNQATSFPHGVLGYDHQMGADTTYGERVAELTSNGKWNPTERHPNYQGPALPPHRVWRLNALLCSPALMGSSGQVTNHNE